MPLPTRRAIRPDSRHHREARRQRLSGRAGRHVRSALWAALIGLSLIALLIAGLTAIFAAQRHTWVMPTIYTSVSVFVVSVLVMLFSGRG